MRGAAERELRVGRGAPGVRGVWRWLSLALAWRETTSGEGARPLVAASLGRCRRGIRVRFSLGPSCALSLGLGVTGHLPAREPDGEPASSGSGRAMREGRPLSSRGRGGGGRGGGLFRGRTDERVSLLSGRGGDHGGRRAPARCRLAGGRRGPRDPWRSSSRTSWRLSWPSWASLSCLGDGARGCRRRAVAVLQRCTAAEEDPTHLLCRACLAAVAAAAVGGCADF